MAMKHNPLRGYAVTEAGAGPSYEWSQGRVRIKAPISETDGRVTVVEDILKLGFVLPRRSGFGLG